MTEQVVTGTAMHVVYANDHSIPERYTRRVVTIGFRVPSNFPEAAPEDCFFIQPSDVKLCSPDTERKSCDLNRASVNESDFLKGTDLVSLSALVFSWHLWNKKAWDRRSHTLVDHYRHCLRRFEFQEHD